MTGQSWGWTTPEDLAAERVAAAEVMAAWPGVRVHAFARVTVLDWWLAAGDTTVAVAEVKVRRVASDAYASVYLSVSKYLALTVAATALGVAPLFVVRFTDGLRWVDLRTYVPTTLPVLAGRHDRGADNDVEPMLLVPVSLMHPITRTPPYATEKR